MTDPSDRDEVGGDAGDHEDDDETGQGESRADRNINISGDGRYVLNIFEQAVRFERGNLGFSDGPPRRLTGTVDDAEVAAVLASYVPPEPFGDADEVLSQRRLVILEGAEGTGKRAGALALLNAREVARPIMALSPAQTVDELARTPISHRRGYLVQDWAGDGGRPEDLAFGLQAFRGRLAESNAYAVLTTTRRQPSSAAAYAIRWERPDVARLLDGLLTGLDVDDRLLARAKKHLAAAGPAVLVEFARRLRKDGEAAAKAMLAQRAHDEVGRCFEDKPQPEWVAFVAALAFLHGVPEPMFERALEDLKRRIWAPAAPAAPGAEDDVPAATPERVLEDIRNRNRRQPLVAVDAYGRDGDGAASRRLVFAEPDQREQVLEQLWDRYDHRLWDPLYAWVRRLAREGDDDLRLSVALGAALLAPVAGRDVRVELLEPWAAGGPRERSTAAYALWWLALDDATAALALATATGWAQGSEPHRRVTAALALSGYLGVRFPADSLRWLWHLAHLDSATAMAAKEGFANLFRTAATGSRPDTSVLSFLLVKLAADDGDPKPMILELTLRVVGARTQHGPAVALLLERRVDAAAKLGPLWAEALVNRPTRDDAIVALAFAVRALDKSTRHDAIRALGRAITAAFDDRDRRHEIDPLREDLEDELMRRAGAGVGRAREIVEALLASPTSVTSHSEEPESA